MICNRCGGDAFLNFEQLPEPLAFQGRDEILAWIEANDGHDVQVCDCCGDGEVWYGDPGRHYDSDDPQGPDGPYNYNGGMCECH